MRALCADLAGASARGRLSRSRRRAVLRPGLRLRRLGPPVRRAQAEGTASVSRDSRPASCGRRRRATCSSTSARRAWISASNWRRRSWRGSAAPVDDRRRGARLPLLRPARPARLRRRHGEPDGRRTRSTPRSIGDEDAAFAGGSYVIVQKYLHDLTGWNALPVEQQEKIIGRDEALGHRTRRRRQADLRAQRPDHDHRRERRANSKSCATTCRSASRARASSAPISSATRARQHGSSGCSRTCSSASRPATTTGCSTSAAP